MINYLENTSQQSEPTPESTLAALANQPKPSEQKLTDFLLSFDRKIDKDDERGDRIRIQTMYLMCRRHRGATVGDRFGFWDENLLTWYESPREMYGTNLFQALGRGAEANYTNAKVKLDVRATGNNFMNRSAEKISKGIYEILSETHWTETTEQQMFYAMFHKLNGFIISRFNPDKGNRKLKLPQFKEQRFETGGTYVCASCESYGEFTTETGYKCQQCGNEDGLTIIDEPQEQSEQLVSGYDQSKNAGETETLIADGFDCEFDDSMGECANFSKAQWFRYRYLCDKNDLQQLYPHLKQLDKTPTWTIKTQWKMALKRYLSSAVNPTSEFDKNLHEVREVYLEPSVYMNFVSPENTTIGDFQIQYGQKLLELFPDGMLVVIVNNEVACVHPAKLHRTVKNAVWLADSMSAWGLGAKAGLPIQKKINHLDCMLMEGIDRSSNGSLIYDGEYIDGNALEGSNRNIPIRPDADRTKLLKDMLFPLNVSGFSPDQMAYLQMQFDVMQKIMGVPDAAIGETNSNNVTASGQMLEANKATGLLVPAKKSQARAMEGWLLDQLCLVQAHYTPDRVKEEFGSRFGEDWLEDELQAFFEADLEKAVTIEYVEGSEVPQTRSEKEQKMLMMITSGLLPPTPQNLNKLVSQSGLDGLDVGGYESNIKVAQKRWTFIYETYKQNEGLDVAFQQMEAMMVDPRTGQRMTDMMGSPLPNPVLMQFLSAPTLQVVDEAEEHPIHEEYWKDKTREILGSSSEASPLLIELCKTMILRHQQGAFAQATKAQTLMGMTQMPMQQAQQQMQTQQADEQMQKQRQIDDETGQRETEMQGQQRQAQVEDKLIDHALNRDASNDSHQKAVEMEKMKSKSSAKK